MADYLDVPRTVAVFGATGSIGASTLDLIARNPERYRASVLTCDKNIDALVDLAKKFKPDHVVVADSSKYSALKTGLSGHSIDIHAGPEGLVEVAGLADLVVLAVTGIAGLMPTIAAVQAGKVVAIANKESLVTAGAIITAEARQSGATILPIDSEHNAVFQAWSDSRREDIHSITLTASGGPFWGLPLEAMADMTPIQAIKHPNWSMGKKVSVDSATMMNKGLEVMEAGVLFDLPEDRVHVLVHPSSVVHGMVQYHDGSLLAQMGSADMRVAISYALAWPERLNWGGEVLDLAALPALEFHAPDDERFPCLDLAREASRWGGFAPTVLNAANEMAVDFFLSGKIKFLDIARLNRHMLDSMTTSLEMGLDAIIAVDQDTRRCAIDWLDAR
jgi:1-deoxy-D-xylulose-5-phosphate reductoisomerase